MVTIKLNRDSDININDQITRQIIFAVMKGSMCTGDKVQSVRSLSPEIGVNINTVSKAYQGLEDIGIFYPRQGIGYFITKDAFPRSERWMKQHLKKELGLIYREAFAAGLTEYDLTDVMTSEFQDKDVY